MSELIKLNKISTKKTETQFRIHVTGLKNKIYVLD